MGSISVVFLPQFNHKTKSSANRKPETLKLETSFAMGNANLKP